MSTNYYLDSPHNEAGHIGKWAGGYFTAKAPEGVKSFDEWAARLQGHKIFAESGYEITPQEAIILAQDRDHLRVRRPRPRESRGEFIDRGVLFVRYDFC